MMGDIRRLHEAWAECKDALMSVFPFRLLPRFVAWLSERIG